MLEAWVWEGEGGMEIVLGGFLPHHTLMGHWTQVLSVYCCGFWSSGLHGRFCPLNIFYFIDLREGGRKREREREIDLLFHLFMHLLVDFLYVPWSGIEPATLAYWTTLLPTELPSWGPVHFQEAKGQGVFLPVSDPSNPECKVCLSVRLLSWFAMRKCACEMVSFFSATVVATNPDVRAWDLVQSASHFSIPRSKSSVWLWTCGNLFMSQLLYLSV